jgi:hypothetical protein
MYLLLNQAHPESCCPTDQYIFTVLHMIEWSKENKRLPDMTLYWMLLDVNNLIQSATQASQILIISERGCHGWDQGFTTIFAISAYHI